MWDIETNDPTRTVLPCLPVLMRSLKTDEQIQTAVDLMHGLFEVVGAVSAKKVRRLEKGLGQLMFESARVCAPVASRVLGGCQATLYNNDLRAVLTNPPPPPTTLRNTRHPDAGPSNPQQPSTILPSHNPQQLLTALHKTVAVKQPIKPGGWQTVGSGYCRVHVWLGRAAGTKERAVACSAQGRA